ncbi:MAG: STAS/SEC14 domain-containing protein [Flavobacteriales bacterium]|nr:STAS/SEC14 domain-containing protein [Flavobacteriales bacterium]
MAVIKTIEAEGHRISIEGDGIIRVYSRGHVTKKGIEEVFKLIIELSKGEKALIYIDPTEEQSMEPEARKTLKALGEEHCLGMAVLTRKNYAKNIANIIITTLQPKFHVKLFTDQSEAVSWLKSL